MAADKGLSKELDTAPDRHAGLLTLAALIIAFILANPPYAGIRAYRRFWHR